MPAFPTKFVFNKQMLGNVTTVGMQSIPALRLSPVKAALGFITSYLPINLFSQTFLAGVAVSVITKESYNFSSTVTNIPLENGTVVSDHVIIQPDIIEQDFEICNISNEIMAENAVHDFMKIKETAQPVSVLTYHGQFDLMIVESISFTHQAQYKGALIGTVRFKKINYAKIATTTTKDTIKKKEFSENNRLVKSQMTNKTDLGRISPTQNSSPVSASDILANWKKSSPKYIG